MNSPKIISAAICFVIFFIRTLCTAAPVPIPITTVSGGENCTLILTSDKIVWSCGDNYYSQLGDDTDRDRYVPVQVYDGNMNTASDCLEDINEISAGYSHSLAMDINHRMWAWGDNYYGELGVGDRRARPTPVQVHGGEQGAQFLKYIISIAAGRTGYHSLAVDSNHFCFSFGKNDRGQLGNGKICDYNTLPVRVHGLNNDGNGLRNIIAVSAGTDHSMALEKIDVNNPNNCKGRIYTWGRNSYYSGGGHGKLGTNNTQVDYNTAPVKVHGVNDVNYLKNIVAISAGLDHSMALEKLDANDPNCKGRVYCWGANGGRLGDGTYIDRLVPVMVHAGRQDPNHPNDIPLKNIIAISAGESHCIALEKLDVVNDSNCRGRVYTWGNNSYGQLGTGNSYSYTPVRVLAPDRDGDNLPDNLDGNSNTTDYLGDDVPIVYISAGYWHSIAVDANGRAYAWGKNTDVGGTIIGQLGIGAEGNKNIPVPLFYIYDLNVYNQRTGKGYKRIQPAINEAINNDVIVVCQGNYSENVNLVGNKTITLRSVDPNNWSVVNNTRICGSSGAAITPDNSGSKISGLTMIDSTDGIHCLNADSTITRCRIENNRYYGIYAEFAHIVVDRCNIADNDIGISAWAGTAVITNNIIHHNRYHGICLRDLIDEPCEIRNNTIVGNVGYGIYRDYGYADPNINSCIIWGNTSGGLPTEMFNNVNFNCIQDYTGDGIGNISSDPCFRDAGTDDYHLTNDSNCIERGDPNFVANDNKTDIDGENRVIDVNVDMGADEFHYCSGRVDIFPASPDGIVNFLDFVVLADAWMTSAGDDDYNDVVDFADNNHIDLGDLNEFCSCWLYMIGDYGSGIGGQGPPAGGGGGSGPPSPPPVDANIIIRIVDVNDNNEITVGVNESITLYLRLSTTEQGSLGIFDVEAMISDTNLGSIDNREYDPNDPNDPNNGTARILAEPSPLFSYVGPGYEQPEGITLTAAILEADFNDGNLAGFVFTCNGQGDVTLSLKNYLTGTYPKLESILIHQVEPNSQQMMMGGGEMEMMMSVSPQSCAEGSQIYAETQESQPVDVNGLVNWLDQLWQTDEEIRESMSQDEYLQFRNSIEESQNY